MWGKIKSALKVLTDVLMFGRAQGWWAKKPGPGDFRGGKR